MTPAPGRASEPRLRVALDAGPLLDPPTGVARYTRELARCLELRGVEVRRYAVALRAPSQPEVARWRAPARLVQGAWRRLDRPAITRLTGAVDVVHATNFVLPALGRVPGVVTVHDLSFLGDDAFPGARRLRDLVPWSLRRAARAITPSAVIAAEIVERYGVDPAAIAVCPEGVAPIFFGATPLADGALAGMGIQRPYALAVGTIEPRKNLPRLLAAWRAAERDLDGWTLVLAGPRGWGPRLPPVRGVIPLGWVGDDTLPGLVAAAEMFCYLSVYEGFGLPPLEAMAAGTAVLAGRYSAAVEVLNEAAMLVDATDIEAVAAALVRLAGDPGLRRRMAMAGRARAAAFTWERTAATTASAYRAALGSS